MTRAAEALINYHVKATSANNPISKYYGRLDVNAFSLYDDMGPKMEEIIYTVLKDKRAYEYIMFVEKYDRV